MADAGPAKEGLIEDGRQETQRRDGGYPVEIQGDEGLWSTDQSLQSVPCRISLRYAPAGNELIGQARFVVCTTRRSVLLHYCKM